MKRARIVLPLLLGIMMMLGLACDGGDVSTSTPTPTIVSRGVGFGIFLVDSGELVLSEQHIKIYHKDTHEIELNEDGIEKWNSYMTYTTIPRLAEGLFGEDFFITIKGTEIYRGKFYSMVSSTSYPGVVILDTLFKLDSKNNVIRIDFGYPCCPSGEDPRNNPDIFSFLEEQGLLSTLTPVTDYISLIDNLREAGAVVEPRGEVAPDFLSAKRKVISVNDSNVQVWEYDDDDAADAEAALISPDGFSVHTATKITSVGWIAPPHFYKVGKLIVLYVGDNQAVIDVLETVLGSQFAGS